MMAVAKFGIGVIFSFCAALGTPYAAEVHALPSATSALTQRAPSMRANASRCPPASMTANDMGGAPSSAAASRAAVSVPLNLSGASSTFATVRLRCGAC